LKNVEGVSRAVPARAALWFKKVRRLVEWSFIEELEN
jgi:hypothetical protein